MKKIKSKKLWLALTVIGVVFAVAAISVFVISLFGVSVFNTKDTGTFLQDLFFLVSALMLSSVIIIVSLYLKP